MKKSFKVVVIGALLALGAVQSFAQTAFTTNWVQMFTISVSGLSQGPTRTTTAGTTLTTTRVLRFTTRQVIVALGQALGVSFSPNARLLVVTPLDGGGSAFIVRDIVNRTRVDRDVSSFFSISTVGSTITRTSTKTNGLTSGTEYSIEAFSLGPFPDGTRLDLQGAATASFANNSPRAQYVGVYGTGTTTNGAPAIVSGMISISGPRLEGVAAQP